MDMMRGKRQEISPPPLGSFPTAAEYDTLLPPSSSPPPNWPVRDASNYSGHGMTRHVAIGCSIAAAFIIAGFVIFWYCFGGGRERRASRLATPPSHNVESGGLPLHTLYSHPSETGTTNVGRGNPGGEAQLPGGDLGLRTHSDLPPPSYEEVVPEQHQRLAGGMTRTSHVDEAEDGVVADGKTPLSEIPFEDVILEPASSSSSSSSANRGFATEHHSGVGDTRGHTNS